MKRSMEEPPIIKVKFANGIEDELVLRDCEDRYKRYKIYVLEKPRNIKLE